MNKNKCNFKLKKANNCKPIRPPTWATYISFSVGEIACIIPTKEVHAGCVPGVVPLDAKRLKPETEKLSPSNSEANAAAKYPFMVSLQNGVFFCPSFEIHVPPISFSLI